MNGANVYQYGFLNLSSKVDDTMLNSNTIVDNTYDTLGRLTQKINKKPDGAIINSYAYTLNNSDERTRITFSDDKYISYIYDSASQLTGVQMYNQDTTANNSYKYNYTYDAAGNPTQRTKNGQTRNYTFNDVNEFASATAPTSTNVSGQASPVSTAPFTVSVNGSPAEVYSDGSWVKENVALTSGLNQIQITGNDKFNRSASDILNITLAAAPIYTYDANGNMTGDGLWTYTYNDENRMITATNPDNEKVEYVYDGLGRMRIIKTYTWNESAWTLDSEKHLAYDANLIIAELDATDILLNSYLRGISLNGEIHGTGGIGGLLESDMNGTKEYPVYDGNGNVTAYTDVNGNILSKQTYSPFGDLVSKEGTSSSPFLFSTIYYDPITKFSFYLYRPYPANLARWTSRDPLGEEGGYDLYTICENDTVNYWDYWGERQGAQKHSARKPAIPRSPTKGGTKGAFGSSQTSTVNSNIPPAGRLGTSAAAGPGGAAGLLADAASTADYYVRRNKALRDCKKRARSNTKGGITCCCATHIQYFDNPMSSTREYLGSFGIYYNKDCSEAKREYYSTDHLLPSFANSRSIGENAYYERNFIPINCCTGERL